MASKPQRVKGKGKCKGKIRSGEDESGNDDGLENPSKIKTVWTDPLVNILQNICRDGQKLSSGEHQNKWSDITARFQQLTGKMYSQETIKNKYDFQKRIWQAWNDLRYKETGCGWDFETGLVLAPKEWWLKKNKEHDRYKRFQDKGVDLATSELWDHVFGFATA